MSDVADKWSDSIIDDTFNQGGFIAANHGLHGELRFRYRPMLVEEFQAIEFFRSQNKTDIKKVLSRQRAEVLKRLKAWSLTDRRGDSVPLNDASMRNLRPELWYRMYDIICGVAASDDDPNENPGDDDGEDLTEKLGN